MARNGFETSRKLGINTYKERTPALKRYKGKNLLKEKRHVTATAFFKKREQREKSRDSISAFFFF